jgi:hypothetical protein
MATKRNPARPAAKPAARTTASRRSTKGGAEVAEVSNGGLGIEGGLGIVSAIMLIVALLAIDKLIGSHYGEGFIF